MFKVTISKWDEISSLIKSTISFETYEAAFEFASRQFSMDVKIHDRLDQLVHHRNIQGQVESYA